MHCSFVVVFLPPLTSCCLFFSDLEQIEAIEASTGTVAVIEGSVKGGGGIEAIEAIKAIEAFVILYFFLHNYGPGSIFSLVCVVQIKGEAACAIITQKVQLVFQPPFLSIRTH